MDTTTDTAVVHKQVGRFSSTPQALRVETNTRVLLHCTLGSDRLPPLAGWESNADNSPDQGANGGPTKNPRSGNPQTSVWQACAEFKTAAMRPANAPNRRPTAKCLPLEDPRRTSRRLISRVPYRSRSQFVHRSMMSESAVSLLRSPTIRRLSVPITNRIVAPGAIVDGATARTTGTPVSIGCVPPLHVTTVMLTNRATLTGLTIARLSISISWERDNTFSTDRVGFEPTVRY
ncbi:MAG: hypothetical protein QOK07_2072 [Gemmatimonadaceae bacterium]|jgi:hypothetical protein|nr:hypothetical protein [Gemmatimonadaceae bacterium]